MVVELMGVGAMTGGAAGGTAMAVARTAETKRAKVLKWNIFGSGSRLCLSLMYVKCDVRSREDERQKRGLYRVCQVILPGLCAFFFTVKASSVNIVTVTKNPCFYEPHKYRRSTSFKSG
jgi:hypothetical protein